MELLTFAFTRETSEKKSYKPCDNYSIPTLHSIKNQPFDLVMVTPNLGWFNPNYFFVQWF